jgi:lauroyl/myristoyl acyltransferase
MNLQQLVSSPRAMRLGMLASQRMPEFVGQRLAWWTAGIVCRIKPALYHTVRTNLRQVLGEFAGEQAVEGTIRRVFYTAIRSHYDLYRALRLPQEKLASLVEFPETAQAIARSLWHREGGSILVAPHLSNFDLAGHAIARIFPEMQVISLPDPPPGFQLANELRQRTGARITPLSSTALREAIQLLRRGGTVSIAGDRPVSELDDPVSFFGHPARVPSGHVRLALKTGAVIVTGCCFRSPETRRYTMHLDPPLEMIHTGNREEEVRINMARVIESLEALIRRWPDQWLMFVPVWPKLLEAETCAF